MLATMPPRKKKAELDTEVAVGLSPFKPGQRVTCSYREGGPEGQPWLHTHHVGTVLKLDDPRAWAGSTWSKSEIRDHIARNPLLGTNQLPVLYDFGMRWDRVDCLKLADNGRISHLRRPKGHHATKARSKQFKIVDREKVREGTYKFTIDAGRDGELRVIVYPDPLPMAVFSPGEGQWLQSDLTESQQQRLRREAKRMI